MPTELHSTNVNLDGLLEVLGKNLYSSPAVAIRELIQNAHDACVRRRIEDQADDANASNNAPQIRLSVDNARQLLTIEDNGSGLTREEILDYLATIGSGYTRVLREKNAEAEAIGYFGLGFLSAYVVSSRVEVWTTSYKAPAEGWYFSSAGGQRFTVNSCDPIPVGSRVVLHLTEAFSDLADAPSLTALVRRYCPLMPVPIRLTNSGELLNDLTPPWLLDAQIPLIRRNTLRMAFAARFDDSFEPLWAWDIPENELGVKGVFWIQDGGFYANSDNRTASVFIRNMFITADCQALLPSWAGFIGAVVLGDCLNPTASREDVQRDANFSQVCAMLRTALVNGLRELASSQSEAWRTVLRRHNEALRGAAIADPMLFDDLADDIEVPTTVGDMSMRHLLSKTDGKLFIRLSESNSYESLLFRVQGIPVLLGDRYAVSGFCREYAEQRHCDLIQIGSVDGNRLLFPKAEVDAEFEQRLRARLLRHGERLRLSRFEPSTVPMLFVEDKEARLKQSIEDDQADRRISSAALSLARLHTNNIAREELRELIVNLDNPLITRLGGDDEPGSQAESVIAVLRAFLLTVSLDVTDEQIDPAEQMTALFDHLQRLLGEHDQ